jgi:hypothetical protein
MMMFKMSFQEKTLWAMKWQTIMLETKNSTISKISASMMMTKFKNLALKEELLSIGNSTCKTNTAKGEDPDFLAMTSMEKTIMKSKWRSSVTKGTT